MISPMTTSISMHPTAVNRPFESGIGQVAGSSKELIARAAKLPREFHIGKLRIFPNVFLSPMSGVTDLCFRRLVSHLSGGRTGLLVSEFVSVEGLTHMNPKRCREMRFTEIERPFGVQIFGGQWEKMAWAAKAVEQCGADFVEINCGCPVPRVVRHGGGAGLLQNLEAFQKIISTTVESVNIPVTVKVRIGWSDDLINVTQTAKLAEELGAAAFIIHGRTRLQGYRGFANWERIQEVKNTVHIPIIGNGDIVTGEDAISRLEQYGTDGVSVGRGAMHNPWVFAQVADLWSGIEWQEPSLLDIRAAFHYYKDLLLEDFATEKGVLGRLKQMSARVCKTLPEAVEKRTLMLRAQSLSDFLKILDDYLDNIENFSGRRFEGLLNLNGRDENSVESGNTYKR